MPRKYVPIDRDYLIQAHADGLHATEIARMLDVTVAVVYNRMKDYGLACHQYVRGGKPRVEIPIDKMLRLYHGGMSVNAIAKKLGTSRTVVNLRLRVAGIEPRGQGEAETLKWSQMSASTRARQVAAAHDASRGRRRTFEERCRQAISVEAKGNRITPGERKLIDMLEARGIACRPQQAIGPYNCDIGTHPVAVEIFGGHWHWSGTHLARTPKRFRYLMEVGWHILVFHITKEWPITDSVADYVTAYIQEARSDPTRRREYRVVRGTGEVTASGCVDDDDISIEPSFTNRRDSRTGRYERVARKA